MSYLSMLAGSVTNFTANIILAFAIHVPFIMQALLSIPYTQPPIITSSSTQPTAHSASTAVTTTVQVTQTYEAFGFNKKIIEVASSTSKVLTLNHVRGKLFSQQEAISAAQSLGFTNGTNQPVNKLFSVQESPAKLTGTGMAWFISGEDRHASTSYCPQLGGSWSNSIALTFEMNETTGSINVNSTCRPIIVDF